MAQRVWLACAMMLMPQKNEAEFSDVRNALEEKPFYRNILEDPPRHLLEDEDAITRIASLVEDISPAAVAAEGDDFLTATVLESINLLGTLIPIVLHAQKKEKQKMEKEKKLDKEKQKNAAVPKPVSNTLSGNKFV